MVVTDTRALLTELLAAAEKDAADAKASMRESLSDGEHAWESGYRSASRAWVNRLKRALAEIGPEF